MKKGKINLVIGGQWGYTGISKLTGYLSQKYDISAALCDFYTGVNSIYISDNGEYINFNQLPISIINKDCKIILHAGQCIDLKKLLESIEYFADYELSDRLMIHPNASVIRNCFKNVLEAVPAKEIPELGRYVGDTTNYLNSILKRGETVLYEGSKGFDLSCYHGYKHPFLLNSDFTPASMLSKVGVSLHYLGDVYGCIRSYPVLSGRGPSHIDQKEMAIENLIETSGISNRNSILNEVGKRLFTFSRRQHIRFISVCSPSFLFVNFINYVDSEDYGKTKISELSTASLRFINMLNSIKFEMEEESIYPVPSIAYIGTGEKNGMIIKCNAI